MITVHLAERVLSRNDFERFQRHVDEMGGGITPEPQIFDNDQYKLANSQVTCVPTEILGSSLEHRRLAEQRNIKRLVKLCLDFGFTVLTTEPEI